MKKKIWVFITIICLVCCSFYIFKMDNRDYSNKGIYVLTGSNEVCYLSLNNYKQISKLNIGTTLYITHTCDGKVYAPICNRKSIGVFKNGQLKKNIQLTYDLPLIAKYNKIDNNTYVFHKTKLSHNEENCITVIDSSKDIEKSNIKYNKGIEDITFTKDKKMIVSSWPLKNNKIYNLDIFDLKNFSILKTIRVPFRITSIIAIDSDIVYALSEECKEPYIYVISIKKGQVIRKIKLPYNNPYKISKDIENGKIYIYVLHQDYDALIGKGVTIIDTKLNKVVEKISNIECPESIYIDREKLFIGNWRDNKIYVIDKKNKQHIENEINIYRPNLGF